MLQSQGKVCFCLEGKQTSRRGLDFIITSKKKKSSIRPNVETLLQPSLTWFSRRKSIRDFNVNQYQARSKQTRERFSGQQFVGGHVEVFSKPRHKIINFYFDRSERNKLYAREYFVELMENVENANQVVREVVTKPQEINCYHRSNKASDLCSATASKCFRFHYEFFSIAGVRFHLNTRRNIKFDTENTFRNSDASNLLHPSSNDNYVSRMETDLALLTEIYILSTDSDKKFTRKPPGASRESWNSLTSVVDPDQGKLLRGVNYVWIGFYYMFIHIEASRAYLNAAMISWLPISNERQLRICHDALGRLDRIEFYDIQMRSSLTMICGL